MARHLNEWHAPPGHEMVRAMSEAPRRQLDSWDGIALYVGVIIGSGVFFAPSGVAAAAPGTLSALLLWGLGALTTAAGALCYAECGARLPHDGGFYVFYRNVYGEAVAFVGGWAALLITYPASIAAMAFVVHQGTNISVTFFWPNPFVALCM